MTRRFHPPLAVALLSLLLGGCDVRQRFQSPEKRVNAAMPPGIELRQAYERLAEQLDPTPAQRTALDKAWDTRLRARALNCSPDFVPSWRHSDAEVKANVRNKGCFSDADRALMRWTGVQRVRLLLEQPPASAGTVPPSVTLPGFLPLSLRDMGRAPVVATLSSQGLELVALDSGATVFKESGGRAETTIAPNGKLFAQSVGNAVRIRSTDGGESLLEIPDAQSIHWLNPRLLVVRSASGKPSHLLSLISGTESPIAERRPSTFELVLDVPQQADRFTLVGRDGASQYEAVERDGKLMVTLLADKPRVDRQPVDVDVASGQHSADGSEWVFAAGEKLVRLNLATLQTTDHPFEPLKVRRATPTADANQFVVNLESHRGPSDGPTHNGNYVFDAAAGTLARVEGPEGQRDIRYFPAVRRLAHTSHPTLWLPQRLDTAAPVPVRDVMAAMLEEANQAKLARAAAEELRLQQTAPLLVTPALLPEVKDARVEGVGVYEAQERVAQPGAGRSTGRVTVTVRRSPRPIVLVLTSYEPVQWVLQPEPGAKIGAILIGGYHDATVTGSGGTRVLKIGRVYAHSQGGPEFDALQREVARWAGKPIGLFQSSYRGGSFSVGGP